MTTHNIFFSIITPVYNGADYLADLIESVQAQDYTHYEHIIVDDGSTDDGATVSLIEHYAQNDSRIRWWMRENKGQYATQNEAIESARGDFIVIIAADDIFVTPDTFSQVANHLGKHSDLDVVYGKTLNMDPNRNLLPDISFTVRPSAWLMRHYCYVAHCSLFVSRRIIEKQNLTFDSSLRYSGDWDWLIRLFDGNNRIEYLPQPFSMHRIHPAQASNTSGYKKRADEYRRVRRKHGISDVMFGLVQHLIDIRVMIIVAFYTLRTAGISGLFQKMRGRFMKYPLTD